MVCRSHKWVFFSEKGESFLMCRKCNETRSRAQVLEDYGRARCVFVQGWLFKPIYDDELKRQQKAAKEATLLALYLQGCGGCTSEDIKLAFTDYARKHHPEVLRERVPALLGACEQCGKPIEEERHDP